MKHLNNYKIFETKKDIHEICRDYDIINYIINDDGSIDVDEDINLYLDDVSVLLTFNKVYGAFDCSCNKLTSLECCPNYVGRSFNCSYNKLTSLEGSPKYIKDGLDCTYNNITSLEGYPEYVGGAFSCFNNLIYSIVRYFINRDDKNNLIELFNYYDIVQGMNVIYDRLIYFYEGIDIKMTNDMLESIEANGYKIIK